MLGSTPRLAHAEQAPAHTVLKIRGYTLKPGTRPAFHERFVREALPMLRRWQVDVVGFGPSLHDEVSYYLMRAFPDVSARQRREDAFYGSDEWIAGPRAAVLADIEAYTTVVVQVDAATLAAARRVGTAAGGGPMTTSTTTAADLAAVSALNDAYIAAVQGSDAARFRELLADDFLCTQADGTLQDREAFLAHVARPAGITGLAAHDVQIRLIGDVALVHARTTYTTGDGRAGEGRYTDVWARRDGRWLAVAAHVTRR
jgi:uncharacterized protein (TIGR02246 family)